MTTLADFFTNGRRRASLIAGLVMLGLIILVGALFWTTGASAHNEAPVDPSSRTVIEVGDARMSLGNFDHHPEGYQCLTVEHAIFDIDGGSVTNCPPPIDFAKRGFVQSYQLNDGPVALYGVGPAGEPARVTLDGASVPQKDGFFFVGDIGDGSHELVIEGETGRQTLNVGFQ